MENEMPIMMKKQDKPRFPSPTTDIQMSAESSNKVGMPGIPHSVTLELASKKKLPSQPSKPLRPASSSVTSPVASTSIFSKPEVKMNIGNKVDMTRTAEVRETLKELLECNQEMMESVQSHMDRQTQLLNQLMKLL